MLPSALLSTFLAFVALVSALLLLVHLADEKLFAQYSKGTKPKAVTDVRLELTF